MFKKPVKVSAQNQLSGKDRKTIKNKLVTQFQEQSLETLLSKNDKIICNKISGAKMLIYMSDQYPLFVDGTGKQDFFPSVYTCAAYQPLTKSIIINEGVESFIFNGANLMWPGVNSFAGLGNFKKDEVVSIKNLKGEVIAVGALGCSLDQLKQSPDGSGVAAYILHYKGDRLWDMGTKQYPEVVLKAKVAKIEEKKEEVKPEVKQQPKKENKKESKAEKQEQESQQEQKPKGKGKQKKEQSKKDKKKQKKQEKFAEPQQQEEQKPQAKGKKNKEKDVQSKEPAKKQPQPVSDDQKIDIGGLLHTSKKEKPQIQMQKKKVPIKFSDDEDDKKGKKKNQKKGAKKVEQQDDQPVHNQPPKKQQKQQEQQENQEDNKKGKGKKGKGKKQQQSEEQQQKPEPKKQANKKKQPKKQQKREQSQEENEEQGEKPVIEAQQKQEKQDKSAISTQLMDQHFKEAFLNVLKLTKIQAQLPVDSGRFFSDYMVLARSQGVKLQIKDSSYKKLGKFYEQMAKQKLIQFKPAKEKKGQQGSTITKIFWQNEELKNYFPTIKRMGEKQVEEKQQVYSKQKLKLSKTVQVDYVYKLNDELKKILYKKVVNYMPSVQEEEAMAKQEDVSKKEIFLTEKQLKQKIQKYINEIVVKQGKQKQAKQEKQAKQKQGKDSKQKKVEKLITLSYKDNKFIYQLLKSQIEEYQENLQKEQMMAQHHSDDQDKKQEKKAKKDKHKKNLFRIQRGYLVNKITKLAQPYYNISDKQTGLNKFRQGNFKGIQLIADKVVNKNVTKIIGLQNFIPSTIHEDQVVKQIHGFSSTLQLKFASSANVQNLPGKNAGKQIVIQGNFVDELENLLISQYGIKKQHITIQNKLGKKKKN